ncbi:hypothetical protein ACFWA5_33170 [Streptomyces mirabilis]|uniref:hypothetical protein n=1 Tax=Streptomyces mirabilis TaxID=68239 RepID=UPI00365100F5
MAITKHASVTSRRPHRWLLASRVVGSALLVHPRGQLDERAEVFAGGLAPDSQHNLVVLDLPPRPRPSILESVARLLREHSGHGGSFRVVPGRGSPDETRTLAQWLADRLDRVVVAPDGPQTAAAGGALFVATTQGRGWLRYEPGQPEVPDSQRFPKPAWEQFVSGDSQPTGPLGIAEAIPGGMWLRPRDEDSTLAAARQHLAAQVIADLELLAVVLGAPGTPALPLEEIAGFWEALDPRVRAQVRFLPYGPVAVPDHGTLGHALADLLGQQVTLYNGFPALGRAGSTPEVHTLGPDGEPGWRPYVTELGYLPSALTGGRPSPPTPVAYRAPVPGLQPGTGLGVYQQAPDAVLEVVASGLWLRPPGEPDDAEGVRSAAADPLHAAVLFSDSTPEITDRVRHLAREVLEQLPAEVRRHSRLLPASAVASPGSVPGHGHRPPPDAAARAEEPGEPSAERQTAAPLAAARAAAISTATLPAVTADAEQYGQATARAATDAAAPVPDGRPGTEPIAGTGRTQEGTTGPEAVDGLPQGGGDGGSAVAGGLSGGGDDGPAAVDTPPRVRPRPRLESAPDPSTAPKAPPTAPPAPAPAAPATRTAAQPDDVVRAQPVPEPAASVVVAAGQSVERERAWLRRTLAERYDEAAGFVTRVMSETPGLRSGYTEGTEEKGVLADLAAVRLYLASGAGATVNGAVHSATVGPHVPLARCVASGLRQLPSHRGVTLLRATLTEAQLDWYRTRREITDWGFCSALTNVRPGLPGETDILIWSLTGRRTALLDPEVPDRVVFLPGTEFRVLHVTDEDGHRTVLLRETASVGVPKEDALDQVALGALRKATELVHVGAEQGAPLPERAAAAFCAAPGLAIRPTGPATKTDTTRSEQP